jgi:CheY-like chemotaxis protein
MRGQTDVMLIAVTAFSMQGDSDQAFANGFDGDIPKPIDPETFAAVVAGFTDRGATRGSA